jgi:hypothetical protein
VDPRVSLLREFYRGLPKDRAKLETPEHGFLFLEKLLSDGIALEYGELTLSGLLHKYKLARIPEHRMNQFLLSHVEQACNVCLYFGETTNDLFCFNLDNNHLVASGALIPEMEMAVRVLAEQLRVAGCEPLVVASGRGYHLWARLEAPVPNARLYDFMLRSGVTTVAALHRAGHDYHRVKFNFYPDPRTRDVVSLRLFGSRHAKTGVFSRILTADGLLEEGASWDYFADHLQHKTIAVARFESAYRSLLSAASG